MPMYLDRHDVGSVSPEEVAAAHMRDLEVQDKYGVRYISYWCDPDSGTVFCFCEAPDMKAAEDTHREAHGLVANNIIEVDGNVLTSFMGQIIEHPPGTVIADSAFRAILFTDIVDSTSLTQRLGDVKAREAFRVHDQIVRDAITQCRGTEVKHTGDGIMASFPSVTRAVEAACTIHRELHEHNQSAEVPIGLRIGVAAGEPVTEDNDLFGAAVQLAARICASAAAGSIFVSTAVRELCVGKGFAFESRGQFELKGFDEPVILFEVGWQTVP
jgi:class 3 adenylate cyclase